MCIPHVRGEGQEPLWPSSNQPPSLSPYIKLFILYSWKYRSMCIPHVRGEGQGAPVLVVAFDNGEVEMLVMESEVYVCGYVWLRVCMYVCMYVCIYRYAICMCMSCVCMYICDKNNVYRFSLPLNIRIYLILSAPMSYAIIVFRHQKKDVVISLLAGCPILPWLPPPPPHTVNSPKHSVKDLLKDLLCKVLLLLLDIHLWILILILRVIKECVDGDHLLLPLWRS